MPAARTATKRPVRRTKAAATKAPAQATKRTATPKAKASAKRAAAKSAAPQGHGPITGTDVKDIVRQLKAGSTMTEIRAAYGAGPKIRKALTEAGYNTKGERIDVEEISTKGGSKAFASRVAKAREAGHAWYAIEIATGHSEAQLKTLLDENGFAELAEGRVIKDKPAPVKRAATKAKTAAKATATVAKTTARKTATKATATKTAAKVATEAKRPARRVSRRKADPSNED